MYVKPMGKSVAPRPRPPKPTRPGPTASPGRRLRAFDREPNLPGPEARKPGVPDIDTESIQSQNDLWREVESFLNHFKNPSGIFGRFVLKLSGEERIPLEGGAYGLQHNIPVPHGSRYPGEELVVNYGKMETFGKVAEHLRLGLRDMKGSQIDQLRVQDMTRTILRKGDIKRGIVNIENIEDFLEYLENQYLGRPHFTTTRERLLEARSYLKETKEKLRQFADIQQRLGG